MFDCLFVLCLLLALAFVNFLVSIALMCDLWMNGCLHRSVLVGQKRTLLKGKI